MKDDPLNLYSASPTKSFFVASGIIVFSCFFLSGCYRPPVEINRSPALVEIRETDESARILRSVHMDGATTWFFHCLPKFHFEKQRELHDTDTTIKIKVTKVRLDVSLAIKIIIPHNVSEDTRLHEKGHQLICQQIYANAEEVAFSAAASMLGKEYSASAESEADATRMAVDLAAQDLCAKYRSGTSEVTSSVSQIYDELTSEPNRVIQSEAVQNAFAIYRKNAQASSEEIR
ncbi:MAG: hypothetical protein IAF58_12375 [Leptolyngbya sp.]|nr:hypothetical protein [Candidatus Melainabacteria bacterium]